MHTTAFHEACTWGHTEILKRLRPDPTRDDLGKLFEEAAFFARQETMAYLLALGANPNNKPGGGSNALEACIRHLSWEDSDRILHRYGPNDQTPSHRVSRTREAIRLLIDRGAIWRPEASSMNDVRKILYKIEPEVTVELVGLRYGISDVALAKACRQLQVPKPARG